MIKLKDILFEGVNDPGIFKAIFIAGGPGSGKTYIAKQLFGVESFDNYFALLLIVGIVVFFYHGYLLYKVS